MTKIVIIKKKKSFRLFIEILKSIHLLKKKKKKDLIHTIIFEQAQTKRSKVFFIKRKTKAPIWKEVRKRETWEVKQRPARGSKDKGIGIGEWDA